MQYLEADGTDDAYIPASAMRELSQALNPSRMWLVDGSPSTLQIGKHYIKCINRFDAEHYQDEEGFRSFVAQCSDLGVPRPSSYASVFHFAFKSPRLPWSANVLLGAGEPVCGGWQEAREMGVLAGRWYRYDMESAYLWSSTLGLPRIESLEYVRDVHTDRNGIYRLTLNHPTPGTPHPYHVSRDVVATLSEIDMYRLDIADVVGGMVWSDCYPEDYITRHIPDVPWRKRIARAYWGRWASQGGLRCVTRNGNDWEMKNPMLNLLWAHLIIGRVKQRIYEIDDAKLARVAHVYVDSVVVDRPLPTHNGLGGWRLESQYDGLHINGVGRMAGAA